MVDGGGGYTTPTRYVVTDVLLCNHAASIREVREEIHHESTRRIKETRPLYDMPGQSDVPYPNTSQVPEDWRKNGPKLKNPLLFWGAYDDLCADPGIGQRIRSCRPAECFRCPLPSAEDGELSLGALERDVRINLIGYRGRGMTAHRAQVGCMHNWHMCQDQPHRNSPLVLSSSSCVVLSSNPNPARINLIDASLKLYEHLEELKRHIRPCVILIYGHMTMCYTHIWSYDPNCTWRS